MKISTLLSVSAVLAMFTVVACSSSTTPNNSAGSSSSGNAGDDDDDDGKPKTSSSSSSSSSSGASSSSSSGGAAGDDAACLSCLAEDPTMKKVLDCEDKCAETDKECVEKCATDNGCTGPASACAKQAEKCADKCEPPPPTDAEIKACSDCLAPNAQATAIDKCFLDANSQAEADKCNALDCDAKCEDQFTTCDAKCGG